MNGTHICYNVDHMSADRLMLISKGFDGIDSHLPTEKAVEKKKTAAEMENSDHYYRISTSIITIEKL